VHGVVRAQTLEELPDPGAAQRRSVSRGTLRGTFATEPGAEIAPSQESLAVLAEVSGAIGNSDVHAMAEAEFSDSTIISVIGANDVDFDVSPRALVALKRAGVSEPVIEAMLAADAEKKRVGEPVALSQPLPRKRRSNTRS
jgi:hypothetical protein